MEQEHKKNIQSRLTAPQCHIFMQLQAIECEIGFDKELLVYLQTIGVKQTSFQLQSKTKRKVMLE